MGYCVGDIVFFVLDDINFYLGMIINIVSDGVYEVVIHKPLGPKTITITKEDILLYFTDVEFDDVTTFLRTYRETHKKDDRRRED